MDRTFRAFLTAALTVLVLLPLAGCTPKSPEEKIAEIRAQYTVELNAWSVQEPAPMADHMMAGEDHMMAGEEGEPMEGEAEPAADMADTTDMAADMADMAGETEGEGGDMMGMAEPEPKDILFDLVILFKGDKALGGITVNITQADANQQEKKLVRHYVETPKIVKGQTIQADFVLGGFVVEEGDVFAASVEPGIPADLSEFQEFQSPAP